jgi:hypothetical protein
MVDQLLLRSEGAITSPMVDQLLPPNDERFPLPIRAIACK